MSEIEIFVLDRKVKDVLFQCWSLFWQPCCPTIPGFNGPVRKREEQKKTFFLDPSLGQLLDHYIWWQTLKNIHLRSLRNYKRWVFLTRTHLSYFNTFTEGLWFDISNEVGICKLCRCQFREGSEGSSPNKGRSFWWTARF